VKEGTKRPFDLSSVNVLNHSEGPLIVTESVACREQRCNIIGFKAPMWDLLRSCEAMLSCFFASSCLELFTRSFAQDAGSLPYLCVGWGLKGFFQ